VKRQREDFCLKLFIAEKSREPPMMPPVPVAVASVATKAKEEAGVKSAKTAKKREPTGEEDTSKKRRPRSMMEPSDAAVVIPIVASEDYNWLLSKHKSIGETKERALRRINELGLTEWRTVQFMEKHVLGFMDDFENQREDETGEPPELYRAIEKDLRLLCSLRKSKEAEAKVKEEKMQLKEELDQPGKVLRQAAVEHTNGGESLGDAVKSTRAGGAEAVEETSSSKKGKSGKPLSAKKVKPADLMFETEAKKAENEAKRLQLEEQRLALIPVEQEEARQLKMRKIEAKEKAEENRHKEAMAHAEAQKIQNELIMRLLMQQGK
jgi:hypothetical protein